MRNLSTSGLVRGLYAVVQKRGRWLLVSYRTLAQIYLSNLSTYRSPRVAKQFVVNRPDPRAGLEPDLVQDNHPGGQFKLAVLLMNQYPPIVVAARSWDVQLMRTELAAGADPHLRTGLSDNSPLIVKILRNTIRGIPKKEDRDLVECVRLLLEAGADPCAMDDRGWTAVYFAAMYGYHESLAVLLEAGAGAVVNTPIDCGWTPLAQAAQSGHLECVELLLAAGADVGLNPYFTTDPSRFVVDAGLAQLINANCHVLKISLPAWGIPKNHKHLSLRAARGFFVYPKRMHSF